MGISWLHSTCGKCKFCLQVFSMEDLQDAMIQVKKGRIKEPNAVIRISH